MSSVSEICLWRVQVVRELTYVIEFFQRSLFGLRDPKKNHNECNYIETTVRKK